MGIKDLLHKVKVMSSNTNSSEISPDPEELKISSAHDKTAMGALLNQQMEDLMREKSKAQAYRALTSNFYPNINGSNSNIWNSSTTTPAKKPKTFCRACGKSTGFGRSEGIWELYNGNEERTQKVLCRLCEQAAEEFAQRQYITAVQSKKPEDFCPTCSFHFKACVCPAGKALQSMKEE